MHWKIRGSRRKFIPNLDKFGFVYIITNKKSGKAYIGCKQYFLNVKTKHVDSNWETYMSSSSHLLKDIHELGKKKFKFEVIAEYKNKRSLRYYECYYQMKYNVLSSTFKGTDEAAFYNSYVGGKWFRPVESYQDPEYRKKLSEAAKKRTDKQDPEYRKKLSESLKGNTNAKKRKKNERR